ncbi:MAG: hypothetical protein A2Y62_08400 [Candidatus Fischerbacteria bacterium RBG_13_37_8]|uniref:Uncharacterized protein n=1 Tax=Candidatus Fischerbacteria bacterium RBG_13_37_8 TaxID=1817863 RepID=A0A1F5VQR0_9BACT|nr:MAG: hypothetical protein A2Y62_08400 [Candidatus Fischerbacteria bacterium RBG_13_37_8]
MYIGYNRKYASWLLRNYGKKVFKSNKSGYVVYQAESAAKRLTKRNRPRIYGEEVEKALKKIWAILDFICGKRLVTAIKDIVKLPDQRSGLL